MAAALRRRERELFAAVRPPYALGLCRLLVYSVAQSVPLHSPTIHSAIV
jgi:hypothetical protein